MRVPGIGIAKENNTGERDIGTCRACLCALIVVQYEGPVSNGFITSAQHDSCSHEPPPLHPISSHHPVTTAIVLQQSTPNALPCLCCVCLQLLTLSQTWCSWLACSALLLSLVSHPAALVQQAGHQNHTRGLGGIAAIETSLRGALQQHDRLMPRHMV